MSIRALLIGESYGKNEELFQHPFVGPAGVKLAQLMAQSGLGPELDVPWPSSLQMMKYWEKCKAQGIEITNVFNAHPPDNKTEMYFTNRKDGVKTLPSLKHKYLHPDYLHHILALKTLIVEKDPNLIICLGNYALWAVLGEDSIKVFRGAVRTCDIKNIKVIPTYHPSSLFHQTELTTTVLSDFEKCKREIETKFQEQLPRWVLVQPTFDEIEEWYNHSAEYYAADVESGQALFTKAEKARMKKECPQVLSILAQQISMIGFARDPYNAIVIPLMSRQNPDLSYWQDPNDEMKALRWIEKFLKKPIPKIFQNGMYDIPMILNYKIIPKMCDEDTMLLHHSIYPEMPKSLGFLASIYENLPVWKTMYAGGENLKRDD